MLLFLFFSMYFFVVNILSGLYISMYYIPNTFFAFISVDNTSISTSADYSILIFSSI